MPGSPSDLYEDKNKPAIDGKRVTVTYRVSIPNSRNYAWIEVEPDNAGYISNISGFEWFGIRSATATLTLVEKQDIQRAIYEWLKEWELIELRPIGPEDSEYFATAALTCGTEGAA